MHYAIIADIHANLSAFTVVLDDIQRRGGASELWCLGDVVGYGPDPHGCIELLRHYKFLCVAGNHDWAAIGKIDTATFNPDAAAACLWTARQLGPEDKACLEGLPERVEVADFTLVHGSPREPIWEYLVTEEQAGENEAYFDTRFCLVGHSHVPLVFELMDDSTWVGRWLADGETLVLGGRRLIINPGGVGQPRDGDPRAAYAIYDDETGTVSVYRVAYNIEATQARMKACGLPPRLISRLSHGH